jgi:hypothetical protein
MNANQTALVIAREGLDVLLLVNGTIGWTRMYGLGLPEPVG